MRYCSLTLFFAWLLSFGLAAQDVALRKGLRISASCSIKAGKYQISPEAGSAEPVCRIEGENITVDFQQAELRGAALGTAPDAFSGYGIVVKGRNITLRNARLHGFKVALLAEGVENLRLENCDFSYNYRPRLHSGRERECFADWLSYHQNENDEWLRYGAGIYLKNCPKATVRECRITGNQNALLMRGCDSATVYNNYFCFNSGLGIGLYRSSRNKLMHNRLDWNVRGYSHGFYQRGQDSAGILLYEQSSENTIAYNSATHCGDGLFLWAGQTTMDSGLGGCNDNLIFGNDFSHAPTNGVEVTFSRNHIQGNIIQECTHGIWGGYSYGTLIMGNYLANCKTGIAIEHGQNDTIQRNLFHHDSTGIRLWARATQPADWGYAQKRDTRSHDILLDRNVFLSTRKPLMVSGSQNVSVNGENLFFDYEKILDSPQPNENLKFLRNDLYATEAELAQDWATPELAPFKALNFSHPGEAGPENPFAPLDIPLAELQEPDSLPDGMLAVLPPGFPRGRQFIVVGEWGPFDFRRPIAVLDTVAGNQYALALIGPSGDWRLRGKSGVRSISAEKGTIPAAISLERDPGSDRFQVEFEYSSPQTTVTQLGEKIPPGTWYKFDFQHFEHNANWTTEFFAFPDSLPPTADVFAQKPLAQQQTPQLWHAWWGSPQPGLPADRFATRSSAQVELPSGRYRLRLCSDDGARLFLDGQLLLDDWARPHEAQVQALQLPLGGKHQIRIEHYDLSGFSTLDFRIEPE
jgi:hypothetical protein